MGWYSRCTVPGRMRIADLVVASGALFAACSSDPPDDHGEKRARIQWNSHTLASYRFTWQETCTCAPDEQRAMRVVVAGGQIARVVYADDGTAVPQVESHDVKTVDAVFDRMETSIEDGDSLDLEFDPVLSYPTLFFVHGRADIADYAFKIALADLEGGS